MGTLAHYLANYIDHEHSELENFRKITLENLSILEEWIKQGIDAYESINRSDPVDIIARGYEWMCPYCSDLNVEYEYREFFFCSKCGKKVDMNNPEHAF